MLRSITGFHRDEEQDWVAELSCGHPQHVRHNPPFIDRAWVVNEEDRRERLGTQLNCIRCDELELPEGYEVIRQTPVFTNESIPSALLSDHLIKRPGMWGRVCILEGELELVFEEPLNCEIVVTTEDVGIIPPEIAHRVILKEDVRFLIEFLSRKSE